MPSPGGHGPGGKFYAKMMKYNTISAFGMIERT